MPIPTIPRHELTSRSQSQLFDPMQICSQADALTQATAQQVAAKAAAETKTGSCGSCGSCGLRK